jgi:hypothetical protein
LAVSDSVSTMATTRTSNSGTVGWLFVVAGVLYLLDLLLAHVGHTGKIDNWIGFFAFALLAVGFVILFLWRSIDLLLRIAFIVAAVGWAILALNSISVLNFLGTLGEILVLVGVLVAGIVIFARGIFTRRAGLAFLIFAILTALLMLTLLTGFLAAIALVLSILFGVALVVTGVLVARRY